MFPSLNKASHFNRYSKAIDNCITQIRWHCGDRNKSFRYYIYIYTYMCVWLFRLYTFYYQMYDIIQYGTMCDDDMISDATCYQISSNIERDLILNVRCGRMWWNNTCHEAAICLDIKCDIKAKPHGCCIFSMILHEAPSMETTTPKGEWFPCWVAEWSIMENM